MYKIEKVYRNFKELHEDNINLAEELLDEVGNGEWQNEPIMLHVDVREFAKYELTEGWYAYFGLGIDKDWNGEPNPLDYINLAEFGNDLMRVWDSSTHHMSSTGEIFVTIHGW